MKNKAESGFSLVEVLVVMVIIGIVTAITVPYMRQAKGAAEDGNAYASMKTMLSSQTAFYTQKGRYGRLDELNQLDSGVLGTVDNGTLIRGNFTFRMDPVTPTDEELKEGFTIIGTKPHLANETPVVITLNQRGHTAAIY